MIKYFDEEGSQIYIVFQSIFNYIQMFSGTDKIFAWKLKGLPEESFKTQVTSGNSFTLKLIFIYKRRIEAKFKGNCLIQDKSFTHRNFVIFFIVYEPDTWI